MFRLRQCSISKNEVDVETLEPWSNESSQDEGEYSIESTSPRYGKPLALHVPGRVNTLDISPHGKEDALTRAA